MNKKHLVRVKFRNDVLKRCKNKCGGPNCKWKAAIDPELLEVHHCKSRDLMPGGGYVKENGIALCSPCHVKAEEFWSTGISAPNYSMEELYKIISSSEEKAIAASGKLKQEQKCY